MKHLYLAFLILLGLNVYGAQTKSTVQKCLNNICLRNEKLTETDFVKNYGTGDFKKSGDQKEKSEHCFFNTQNSVWIKFTFNNDSQRQYQLESILLSNEKLCSKKILMKIPQVSYATENGVKLGDSVEEVKNKLGVPSNMYDNTKNTSDDIIYSSRLGDTALVYDIPNDILFNFIYISKKGYVNAILLEDSP